MQPIKLERYRVIAFQTIQYPLVWRLRGMFPTLGIICYADDLKVHSAEKSELEAALREVQAYDTSTGIRLNPDKTQYLSVG
eukprot:950833-Amphidinium_carterae.1